MTTSLFGVGASVQVNVNGTLVPQVFTGTAGQTVFNITNFTYVIGTNSLLVWINGQKQILSKDFVETSPSQFTLVEGVVAGDVVEIIGFPQVDLTAVNAGSVNIGGTYSLQQYINDGVINVKNYPYLAKGDGVTDDTAAILAALATSRSIFIPKGIYQISGDLVFTAQNATPSTGRIIYGEGMGDVFGNLTDGGTILRLTGTNNGLVNNDTLPFCTIRDLQILGANTSGRGIYFTGTSACSQFTNLAIYTGKQAIYQPNIVGFGASFANIFMNCHVSSFTEHALEVAGGPGTNLIGCYAHNFPAAKCGFRVYTSANFVGCNAVDVGTTCAIVGQSVAAGDAVNTSGYTTFVGCNFESFTTMAVDCRNAGSFSFRDCLFAGTGAYTCSIQQNFGATAMTPILVDNCTFFNSTAGFVPSSGAIWQITSYYPVGAIVQNDAPKRLYQCTTAGISAGAGGPTGVGAGIADGTAVWKFIAVAAASRVKNSELYVINGGQGNFVVNNCPSLGTKPQVDFGGIGIMNAAGNGGNITGLDGVTMTVPQWSGMFLGPMILAGPAVSPVSLGTVAFALGNEFATTVGAAGGASALPATPLGYLRWWKNGTRIKVPYYND